MPRLSNVRKRRRRVARANSSAPRRSRARRVKPACRHRTGQPKLARAHNSGRRPRRNRVRRIRRACRRSHVPASNSVLRRRHEPASSSAHRHEPVSSNARRPARNSNKSSAHRPRHRAAHRFNSSAPRRSIANRRVRRVSRNRVRLSSNKRHSSASRPSARATNAIRSRVAAAVDTAHKSTLSTPGSPGGSFMRATDATTRVRARRTVAQLPRAIPARAGRRGTSRAIRETSA
jgi:hypothetical protein